MNELFNYLGNAGLSSQAAQQPSLMQNLGSAWARSKMAGGGLAGLTSALSPSFASGVQNAMQPLSWGSAAGGSGGGLKF